MSVRIVLTTVCLLATVVSASAQPASRLRDRVWKRARSASPPPRLRRSGPTMPPAPTPRREHNRSTSRWTSRSPISAAVQLPIKRTVSVVVADGFSGIDPIAVGCHAGRARAAEHRRRSAAARRRQGAGEDQSSIRLAGADRSVDRTAPARHGRQDHAPRHGGVDSRERQADDRRAVGRPDRRSAGHGRSKGDDPTLGAVP